MALKNPRYALLSLILLIIVFAVIYLLSGLMRGYTLG
jgi:NADH:ubiquinone oxidoreductase subunit 6 (subunit J)